MDNSVEEATTRFVYSLRYYASAACLPFEQRPLPNNSVDEFFSIVEFEKWVVGHIQFLYLCTVYVICETKMFYGLFGSFYNQNSDARTIYTRWNDGFLCKKTIICLASHGCGARFCVHAIANIYIYRLGEAAVRGEYRNTG